jgi:hypothetical protein
VVARRRHARERNTRALVIYAMVLQRRSVQAWAAGAAASKETKRMLAMAMGRGSHSFPFWLNLSLLCHFPLILSLLCPPYNPN